MAPVAPLRAASTSSPATTLTGALGRHVAQFVWGTAQNRRPSRGRPRYAVGGSMHDQMPVGPSLRVSGLQRNELSGSPGSPLTVNQVPFTFSLDPK